MDSFNIFLSSVFGGMEEERDLFTRFVLPRVRMACEERGVRCNAIDLRWGVDSDLIPEASIVEHCLEQMDRAVPVFIGLVSKRYGSLLPLKGEKSLSATHHEFRHALAADRERLFFVKTTSEAQAAQQSHDGLRQMLTEIPAAERFDYSDSGELYSKAVAQLITVLERHYPLELPAQPLVQSAYRQNEAQRVHLSRIEGLEPGSARSPLGYNMMQIVDQADKALPLGRGMALIECQTSADAELIGAAMVENLARSDALLFHHQHRLFGELSGARAMRRLLAFLAKACGWPPQDPMEMGDARVRVMVSLLLRELETEGRVLRVILVRPNPVDLLEQSTPLLISPAVRFFVLTSPEEIAPFPERQHVLTLPPQKPEMSAKIIATIVAQSGKGVAMNERLLTALTQSPVSASLSGSALLAWTLVSWGDLKPEAMSQNDWLASKVAQISQLTSPDEVFGDLLRGASVAISGIMPEFAIMAELVLDVLRVVDTPLELSEVTAIAAALATERGISIDATRLDLAMTLLDGLGGVVSGQGLAYRLLFPEVWPMPEDASEIHRLVVMALLTRSPDARRASLAGRSALDHRPPELRRRLAMTPGYLAAMSPSLATAVAAELPEFVEDLQALIDRSPDLTISAPRCQDALAVIAGLALHEQEACMALARSLADHPRGPLFESGSAEAEAAHAALSTALRADSAGLRQGFSALLRGKGDTKLFTLLDEQRQAEIDQLGLSGEKGDKAPQRDEDFRRNFYQLRPKVLSMQEPLRTQKLLSDLVSVFAVAPFSQECVTASLDLSQSMLDQLGRRQGAEQIALSLCLFACLAAIGLEETSFANQQAADLQRIEDLGLNLSDKTVLRLAPGSMMLETVDKVLTQLHHAARSPACDRQFRIAALESLVDLLAQSDRRDEMRRVVTTSNLSPDELAHFENNWAASHFPANERLSPKDLLMESAILLRRFLPYVQ
ncbi:DUF4062 domain-containing protein [Thioclava kandeliae]|uniref:DUF4062 domain-containing protein n=1 Tax=Thioclava kandeliae TaxID=3070818 RepID=A0ABV1SJ94_9RHOB